MELKITIYRADTANKILIVVSTLFSVASQNVNPTMKKMYKYKKYMKIKFKIETNINTNIHIYTYYTNSSLTKQ